MGTLNKEYLLNKSKSFCMLPWVHMHYWPNGSVMPCCVADSSSPLGNVNTSSVQEIWNGEAMRRMRCNMLEDRLSPECKRCIMLEDYMQGYRQTSNIRFQHHFDLVETTQGDGSVDEIRMAMMDIRFSNLCNMRCHTCGPDLSSSWQEEHSRIYAVDASKPRVTKLNENFWQQIEPLLNTVERVYFAGGEPLISEEHYRVMDFWLKNRQTTIKIEYTTNFSQLNYKKYDLIGLWNQFSDVKIFASLDASYERGEYLRKGTRWKTIVDNRKRLIAECPKIEFFVTPTISVFNVEHFPDFHTEWIERGLVKPNNIRLNLLTDAAFFGADLIPLNKRVAIIKKYERSLEAHLRLEKGEKFYRLRKAYQAVISYLKNRQESRLDCDFLKKVYSVDLIRKENCFEVFPELAYLEDNAEAKVIYLNVREHLNPSKQVRKDIEHF